MIVMDTTYWGRNFGVMVFKDSYTGSHLLKFFVRYESNLLYQKGLEKLKEEGFTIVGIVCDGRKGLLGSFGEIPTQMCQFHQVAIIRRYLTKRPRHQSSRELKEIVSKLNTYHKNQFLVLLEMWKEKWNNYLNERTVNEVTGKSHYTHKRLRSAYRSLKNNSSWLFTWKDYSKLNMPNTTNALEGVFAELKTKMRVHNGLSKKRKIKFIDEFFKV